MKSLLAGLCCLALAAVSPAAADDAQLLARLDQALPAVANLTSGQDAGRLVEIEQIVFQLQPGSAMREPVEQKLLEVLRSAATPEAKAFLCQQLRVIGTARSIPALEPLLSDPGTAHMARYALGGMEFPEASAALHRGLGNASGQQLVGIINSLADRRYQPARPDLVRLLSGSDQGVASAAARALGRLGGAEAIDALRAARAQATGETVLDIDHALLNIAAELAEAGQAAAAAEIYAGYQDPALPRQLRCAALRGLVLTRSEAAAERLAEAIRSSDTGLSRYAISLMPLVPGTPATQTFVAVLKSLPPDDQALALRALGARGDAAAASDIGELTSSEEGAVRLAALEALGHVGDAATVPILIEVAAASEGHQRDVARRSLVLLAGAAIDARLLKSLQEGGETSRAEAIRGLAARGVRTAVAPLLQAASSDSATVRHEAIAALGTLAGSSDLLPLVRLMARPAQPEDRVVVLEAAGRALLRMEDKAACAQIVLSQMNEAPTEARPALIRLLGKSGSPAALPALRTACRSSDAGLREAAVESLAEWPDGSVSGDLLELLAGSGSPALKERALQGYLRMAGASQDPTAMYSRALARVEAVNEKKLVLAGLGLHSDLPAALQLVLPYLENPPLQATAGLAALRIANRLKDRDAQLARSSLHKVLQVVAHEDVQQRAREVLNDMDKFQDHILQWLGAGPFTEKGRDGPAVYQTAFAPEQNPQGVSWQPITKGIGSWEIDLEATFGGLDYCAAYVRTRIWSETAQEALLEMGCDDALKAWLNGQIVYDQWTEGGVAPRQKRVPVRLAKGWNELMLKVVDQQGGWAFACRVRQPDGAALPGTRIALPSP